MEQPPATPSEGIKISTADFTTKRIMGAILVVALLALGIAWIGLSINGFPGWINIVFILIAILLLIVTVYLFFSKT